MARKLIDSSRTLGKRRLLIREYRMLYNNNQCYSLI